MRGVSGRWLLCGALLSMQAPLHAVELTPYAGYRFGGSVEDAAGTKVEVDDASSAGLIIGFDIEPHRRLELLYSHQSSTLFTEGKTTPLFDLDIDYLHIGGTVLADEFEHLTPFMSGGLGLTYMNPATSGADSETRFSLSLGGGLHWHPSSNVGVRLEARAHFTLTEPSGSLFCTNGACELYVSGGGFVQYETMAGVSVGF